MSEGKVEIFVHDLTIALVSKESPMGRSQGEGCPVEGALQGRCFLTKPQRDLGQPCVGVESPFP